MCAIAWRAIWPPGSGDEGHVALPCARIGVGPFAIETRSRWLILTKP